MPVPQTIDELLSDPSPGLAGSFEIDMDSTYVRHGVLEQLVEHLTGVHGPGELSWSFDQNRFGVVDWEWTKRG
jgi:hypothetical protein